MSDKRYQHCPWYEKLWRRRHQLKVPYRAMKGWMANRGELSFSTSWSIAVGISHGRMNWIHTVEEIYGEDWRERWLEALDATTEDESE